MIVNAPIIIQDEQVGKKIGKHISEYGLNPSSKEDRDSYIHLIREVRKSYDERRIGSWRSIDEDVMFYLKGTDLLITRKNGIFVSLFKGGDTNARFKNARGF